MRRAASKLGLGFAEKNRGFLCMRRSMCSLAAAKKMRSESESESPELNKEKSLCLCFVESAGSYTNQVVRSIRLNTTVVDDIDNDELLPEPEPEVAYKSSSTVYKSRSFSTRFGASRIILPIGTDNHRITHFNLIEFPNSSKKSKLYKFSSPKKEPLLGELNGKLYCIDNTPYLADVAFQNPWGEPKTKPLPYSIGNTPYLPFDGGHSLLDEKRKKPDRSGNNTVVRKKLLRNSKIAIELDGKLIQPFEFLDISENTNSLEWVPLDPPPFINGNDFSVSFLEGSNKILGWERDEVGVYCFDTNNPENGWAESCSSLSNALPFLVWNRRPPLFIRDHHPVLGDFHLMFIYDPKRSLVTSCFLSGNCDYFHIIQEMPLRVPEFYNDLDPKLPISSIDYEFVHLGEQKVCLVLNKFFPHDHHDQLKKNTGILLVVTFEYEFVPIVFCLDSIKFRKPITRLHSRLLGAKRFRYHSSQLQKPGCTKTNSVRMSGVFLL